MDFYMKLPRNKKEFALFMLVISLLSVNMIAPLISCFELGFHLSVWRHTLSVLPFLWLSVIALVLLTFKPAEWMTKKIVVETDSFQAQILVNILCSVFLMSIFLTVIGSWIGSQSISFHPILTFFSRWPRNFAISFAVELLFAQPLARWVMLKFHEYLDAKQLIPSTKV